MKIVDANIILRYLLNDIEELSEKLFKYGNLQVSDIEVVNEALRVYGERRLDFVDTLLYAYHKVGNHKIYTFDKKLNNLLK